MLEKIKKVIYIIAIIIMIPILFISSVILINSYIKPDEVPSFFGWKPFIVLSGSMETQIYAGDIAVIKTVDKNQIKENDIIVMCSDGIIESNTEYKNKELWLKELMENIETDDVQKIADIIMQEAIDNGFGIAKDDMTVIVTKLVSI